MSTVTLTSKNQVTIPVAAVRRLGLDASRRLTVEERAGEIVLKPELPIEKRFEKLWAANKPLVKRALSDDELRGGKQAAREEHVYQKVAGWREKGI